MGGWEYPPLTKRFHVPIVVTGFEPIDLLQGILMAVEQLGSGRSKSKMHIGGQLPKKAMLRPSARVANMG